jgi:hypothetical protein
LPDWIKMISAQFIKQNKKLLSMISIAYFSLLIIFCKIGYMFFPSQVHIFFPGRIGNVCSERSSIWLFYNFCYSVAPTTQSVHLLALRKVGIEKLYPIITRPLLHSIVSGFWS